MKFSTLMSLAAAIAGASAAVTDGLPTCAKSCVNQYVGAGSTKIAGCEAIDVGCVCSNKNFIGDLSCCLADACNAAEQKEAVAFAAQICSSAGVKTPNQVTCNKKPGNATASASAGPTAGGKHAPNSTASGGSAKPTSGASSVFVNAGGFIGAAAAVMVLAM